MIRPRTALLALSILGFSWLPFATRGVSAQSAAADPADVGSLDAIIGALYEVISGPAGQARDWDRFYSLFIPDGARLIPTGRGPNGVGHRVWTPQEYTQAAGASLEERGFYEDEIGRTTEEFGNIVHVFSAYQSKNRPDDAEPFQRGINSIQVLNDGTRYWIVSIFWDAERPENRIPDRYLTPPGR